LRLFRRERPGRPVRFILPAAEHQKNVSFIRAVTYLSRGKSLRSNVTARTFDGNPISKQRIKEASLSSGARARALLPFRFLEPSFVFRAKQILSRGGSAPTPHPARRLIDASPRRERFDYYAPRRERQGSKLIAEGRDLWRRSAAKHARPSAEGKRKRES